MNVLKRLFLNSRKDRRKDVKTERRSFLLLYIVVEELTFLIISPVLISKTDQISRTKIA